MVEETVLPASERQAWVDIDSDAIAENTRVLRRTLGPDVAVFGVVKANGYGHGLERAARAMVRGGAERLVVATVGEALRARAAGVLAPIIVTGSTPPEQLGEALAADLELAAGDAPSLRAIAAQAEGLGRTCAVHLSVDTGMHRLGFLPHEVLPVLDALGDVPGLRWEGAFTHFACADEPEHPMNTAQEQAFRTVIGTAREAGWRFPTLHAGNSAAALSRPQAHFDAVRSGLALYGISPLPGVALPSGMRPALSFRTMVLRVATLPPGSPVSYSATYHTSATQRIATLGVGYADGLRRTPAWREVLINGRRAPVVGRICMDYTMVDVTDCGPVRPGDEATLLGTQQGAALPADEVAEWLGTIPYEVITTIIRP